MQGHYHGDVAGCRFGPQGFHHRKAVAQVEAGRRLVQQYHARLLGQGAGQNHPLPFPARQPVQLTALELGGVGSGHGVQGDAAILAAFQLKAAQVGVAAHQHRFQGGERVGGVVLGHKGDAPRPLPGVEGFQGRIRQLHRAAAGADQPGQRPQQRAFARPVGADQPGHLPRARRKGNRFQHRRPAEAYPQIAGGDGGMAGDGRHWAIPHHANPRRTNPHRANSHRRARNR